MNTNLNSSSRKVLFGGESKVVFNGGGEFHAWVPRGAASLIGVVLSSKRGHTSVIQLHELFGRTNKEQTKQII